MSVYAFCVKWSLNKWEKFVGNEEQSWLASHPIFRAWPSPGAEFPEPSSTRDLPWTHLGIVQEHKVRELQFHGTWTWDICITFCNGTWVMWARIFLSWWRQLQFSHLLDSYPVSETLKKKWWWQPSQHFWPEILVINDLVMSCTLNIFHMGQGFLAHTDWKVLLGTSYQWSLVDFLDRGCSSELTHSVQQRGDSFVLVNNKTSVV